jgi:hypothetical protein
MPPRCPPTIDRPLLPETPRRSRLTSSLSNLQDRTKVQVPLVNFSRKCSEFVKNSRFLCRDSCRLFRKESVKAGIKVDMNKRKYCDPEDMIQFLLALCCQDDSSMTPVSRDDTLDKRFEDCLGKVIPVANSDGLRQRLDA